MYAHWSFVANLNVIALKACGTIDKAFALEFMFALNFSSFLLFDLFVTPCPIISFTPQRGYLQFPTCIVQNEFHFRLEPFMIWCCLRLLTISDALIIFRRFNVWFNIGRCTSAECNMLRFLELWLPTMEYLHYGFVSPLICEGSCKW